MTDDSHWSCSAGICRQRCYCIAVCRQRSACQPCLYKSSFFGCLQLGVSFRGWNLVPGGLGLLFNPKAPGVGADLVLAGAVDSLNLSLRLCLKVFLFFFFSPQEDKHFLASLLRSTETPCEIVSGKQAAGFL